jgi:thiol:disulfide interchange protein
MKRRKLIKKEPWNTILLAILFTLMAFLLFGVLEILRSSG